MDPDALLIFLPLVALTVPAYIAGRLTARAGRMRPAWWLAAAFMLVALVVFGWATRQGQTTTQSLPGVLVAGFVLAPASFAAMIGGAIGRAIARRR